MRILKNIQERLEKTDPQLMEVLTNADTLIRSGYPSLADQRNSWNNKSAEVLDDLTQFKNNYQYILEEVTIRVKNSEYKEYMNSSESDQYKSWNEKSLGFYNNNEIVDAYRQINYYKYIINTINEFINLIRYLSR